MKLVHKSWLLTSLLTASISFTSIGLGSTPAYAACAALPSDKGQATFTISLPSAGNYRVWSRMYSPSTNNNGYYMQVDQTYCSIVVGDTNAIPAGTFTWVNYRDAQPANPITLNLTAGTHTVVVAGLDPGVGIDRVMFLSDLACVPSGTGDNCNATTTATTPVTTAPVVTTPTTPVATPTPVVVGTAAPSGSVSGTLVLSTPPDGSATKVEYSVDGTPIEGNKLDTKTLSNGEHTITATTINPDGTTSLKTTTVNVDNNINFWQWVANIFAGHWWWIRIVVATLIFGVLVAAVLYRRLHSRIHFARHSSSVHEKTYLETLAAGHGPQKP